MRKLNMFLVLGMLVTFLIHAVSGSLLILGADADAKKTAARICIGFIAAHILVSVILTVQTLIVRKKAGAGYFKENKLFWARRISGFAVIIPLIMHLVIFRSSSEPAYRLQVFTAGRLASQILLAAALAIHVLTNIRPVLISFGLRDTKRTAADILLILAAVLLMAAIAFAVYFARWAAF